MSGSGVVVHPRAPARRGAVRPVSWWGRAWARALEEAAYSEGDLRASRALARSGQVGQIIVDRGSFVATVSEGDDAWTVSVTCEPVTGWEMFLELVAAVSGRVAALLAGELPHDLVEQAEEAGVELLPYAGDLQWTCTCEPWTPPCRHALAVGLQVGWLLDRDPFVLMHLRGLTREELLSGLHARTEKGPREADADPDLEAAADAADRARRALELIAEGRPAEHLF